MATLLPRMEEPIRSFERLVEVANERLEQARKLDPWCGLPRPFLEVRTRFQALATSSLLGLVPATLITVVFTRGPIFLSLLGLTTLIAAYSYVVTTRTARFIRSWRSEATAVPGALVMANQMLFDEDEKGGAPGVAVITLDRSLQRDPEALVRIAENLMSLKGASPESLPEAHREIAEHLTDETPDYRPKRVPVDLCGNDQTWVADLVFVRDRMPNRHIDRRLWLFLAHPQMLPGTVDQLPLEIWWNRSTDSLTLGEEDFLDLEDLEREIDQPVVIDRAGVSLRADAERASEPATIRVPILSKKEWIAQLVIAVVLFLIDAGALMRLPHPGIRIGALVGLPFVALNLVRAWRSRNAHVIVDADGIARHTVLGSRRIRWDRIVEVRMGIFDHKVKGSTADDVVTIKLDPDWKRIDELMDAILVRTPELAGVAWGTGLGSLDERTLSRVDFPHGIHIEEGEVFIEGPGRHRIRFKQTRPDYRMIEESVRARLVPRILREKE